VEETKMGMICFWNKWKLNFITMYHHSSSQMQKTAIVKKNETLATPSLTSSVQNKTKKGGPPKNPSQIFL